MNFIYTVQNAPETAIISYERYDSSSKVWKTKARIEFPWFASAEDVTGAIMDAAPWRGIYSVTLDTSAEKPKIKFVVDSKSISRFRLNGLARKLMDHGPEFIHEGTFCLEMNFLRPCSDHFIHADFVTHSTVGGFRERILRIIPFHHVTDHQTFTFEPEHLDWYRVSGNVFSTLNIEVRENEGQCPFTKPIVLEGDVHLTLLFRRV